jgi:hypothetical protein
MFDHEDRQAVLDEEHLRLLSIGYYISGGFSIVFSLLGFLYMAIGIFFLMISRSSTIAVGEPPPQFIGSILAIMGLAVFLFLIVMGVLKLVSGSHIKKRKSRILCMVVAGVNCLEFPYGTLLSIFTFLVLNRSSVKKLFVESGTPPTL